MKLTEKEFESKCMDVIEKIVKKSYNQTRKQAIELSKKLLETAKSNPKYTEEVVAIYQRVLNEFEDADDDLYNELKEQLFKTDDGNSND